MSHAVLDSSPMSTSPNPSLNARRDAPPPRRSLKRSASTASLPTPPQTIEHKGRYAHSRSRSRGSDRETDGEANTDGEGKKTSSRTVVARLQFSRKRQRTDRLDAVLASLNGEDAENPFWDGPSRQDAPKEREQPHAGRGKKRNRERSPTPPVVRSRGKAPVSPPPSRRQKTRHRQLPSTPKNKADVDDSEEEDDSRGPVRDSPNNPFLDESPMSVTADHSPRTPTDLLEKPTIAYVFRGVRTTFANPHYHTSPSARQHALLPVDHPDYSPDPACPPKLLFAEARRRTRSASPSRKDKKPAAPPVATRKVADEWDDSEEEPELHVTPPKRLFQ